jgi:hypothetical protein
MSPWCHGQISCSATTGALTTATVAVYQDKMCNTPPVITEIVPADGKICTQLLSVGLSVVVSCAGTTTWPDKVRKSKGIFTSTAASCNPNPWSSSIGFVTRHSQIVEIVLSMIIIEKFDFFCDFVVIDLRLWVWLWRRFFSPVPDANFDVKTDCPYYQIPECAFGGVVFHTCMNPSRPQDVSHLMQAKGAVGATPNGVCSFDPQYGPFVAQC